MSRRFITLLLVSGSLLQTVLKPIGVFGSMELPILTGLVICIALHTEQAQALYAAVLAGMLHDAFSPAPMGLSIPFYIALAAGINRIRNEVFGDLFLTYVLIGPAALVLETGYYAAVFLISGLRPVMPGLLAMKVAGGLLAGAVIVPLVALAALRLYSPVRRKRRRFS